MNFLESQRKGSGRVQFSIMFGLDTRVLRILWTLAVCYAVYLLRDLLLLLVLSVLAAYILLPVVEFVDHHVTRKRARVLALAVVYVLMLAALLSGGAVVGYYAVQEAVALAQKLPNLIRPETVQQIPLPEALRQWEPEIRGETQLWLQTHGKEMLQAVTAASLKVLSAIGSLVSVFVVLILSFLLMKNGGAFSAAFLEFLAPKHRARATDFLDGMHVLLRQWTRAMVLVAVLTSVAYGIGFSLLGVPYAVLLALVAFPFEFIPLAGPPAAFVIIAAIAFFSGYQGFIALAVFFIAVRLVQDYVVQPYFMGSGAIELPPFVVIVGALAGEALAGIAGILLAVPAIATIRLLYRVLTTDEPVS